MLFFLRLAVFVGIIAHGETTDVAHVFNYRIDNSIRNTRHVAADRTVCPNHNASARKGCSARMLDESFQLSLSMRFAENHGAASARLLLL
jgi:hypothetical protein